MTGTDLVIRMGEAVAQLMRRLLSMIGDLIRMQQTVLAWLRTQLPLVQPIVVVVQPEPLSRTAVAAAGDVPATMQENITTAANANLSRAKLDNIVPHLAASVGEVAGDIQAIEFAIEATAGGAVAKELAASLIGDTDYAADTSKLAAQQVISQAATAILAQANARSATVLTLLK